MKLILLFWLCIISCFCKSQEIIPLTIVNGYVTFEVVAKIDSLTATEIHERALNWFGVSFKSAKSVITSDTPSRIVGTYSQSHFNGIVNSDFTHTLTIDIKEGKVKFLINNTGLEPWLVKGDKKSWKAWYIKMKDRVEQNFNALYQDFIKEVRSNASDW